jgi:battenin
MSAVRILGLSINFGFNIVLTAAHDILKPPIADVNATTAPEVCNPLSTGTFLIADTVAALIGISVAPFTFKNIWIRMILTAGLSLSSYVIIALTVSDVMSFVGVFIGAFAAGFGEATVMVFASQYDKNIVAGYSAGMGAAGIFSSGAYLMLTFFLSTRISLLIMIFVPILMLIDLWLIITPPEAPADQECEITEVTESLPYMEKLKQVPSILPKVILPIFISTFFMCFINQGLFELVYVDTVSLSRDVQYRLYITLCQVGIFVGQSSAQIVQVNELWILAVVEGGLTLFVLGEVMFPMHQIAIIVVIALAEGLIGGMSFVNTFYILSEKSDQAVTSFNMELGMIANEVGAVAAGLMSIPTHKYLCQVISRAGKH